MSPRLMVRLVTADVPGTALARPDGPAFFRSVGLVIENIAIASLLETS